MNVQRVPVVRHQAPGGWRRAVAGFVLGAVAGMVAAAVLPRAGGPRRSGRSEGVRREGER